ncbi:hypothetical protein AB1L42_14185 [Thalassoglobus sp. JC818]|uniref:hypothetical protein n=1 Tax=Thalassoglobus sp. JC818 TaxID=3232136 RepID=UPI00345B3F2D
MKIPRSIRVSLMTLPSSYLLVLLFFDLKNRLFSTLGDEAPIYPYVLKCVLSLITVVIVGFLISRNDNKQSQLEHD